MINRWTDARWMDGWKNSVALAHSYHERKSYIASLVKFCPEVYCFSSVIRLGFLFQNNLKDLVRQTLIFGIILVFYLYYS